jgi:D-alanyl-D-alanine carboxypeptidase
MNHAAFRSGCASARLLLTTRCLLTAAVVLTLLSTGANLLEAQAPDRARLLARIDSVVHAELAQGPTAGISIAVLHRGDLVLARGYGFADLEHQVPATAETVYRLGSVTKHFTSAALLQLVDQGKLSLEDDLTRFLPDYPTQGRSFTIHQLLNHTSGIRNYTSLAEFRAMQSRQVSHDEMVAVMSGAPLDFEPGTGWLYNNSGFYLAGMIVERLSGEGYSEYLDRAIFGPLGMRSSSYCNERVLVPHRARGYDRMEGRLVNTRPLDMTAPYAAGALCSTVLDLLAWGRALHGGRVVGTDSYARLITPGRLPSGWSTFYAYGLATYRIGGRRVIRHGGSINGFQANLSYLPEDDLLIAALANTSGSNPVGISDWIATALLGLPEPRIIDAPLSGREADAIVGRYDVEGKIVRVWKESDRLLAQAEGAGTVAVMRHQGGLRFAAQPGFAFGFYASGVDLAFERPAAGAPLMVLHDPDGQPHRGRRLSGEPRADGDSPAGRD